MQKRMLLFYSHQQLHSDMLVQPTRIPGTAGTCLHRSLTIRTDRIQNHRATAPTQASIRQWAISGVLPCIAHQNPDPADQELSGAAQDTKGSPTYFQDTASRYELIRLHVRLLRSASHSAIAIFRCSQRLSPPESYGESWFNVQIFKFSQMICSAE